MSPFEYARFRVLNYYIDAYVSRNYCYNSNETLVCFCFFVFRCSISEVNSFFVLRCSISEVSLCFVFHFSLFNLFHKFNSLAFVFDSICQVIYS